MGMGGVVGVGMGCCGELMGCCGCAGCCGGGYSEGYRKAK
jgi:hypothetical protein